MKPSLQLTISQNLTLTPQLQQAIKMLQLSTIELQQEIQQITESNPLLESTPHEEKETTKEASRVDEFADFQWSQLYNSTYTRNSFNENDSNFDNLNHTTVTLQDHLRWQLDLTRMADVDRIIATTLIDAINEDGFLTQSITEFHKILSSAQYPVEVDDINAVRHRIQQFDPVGCAAINLSEVLLAQLEQMPPSNDTQLAKVIVCDHIELLGQHNYRMLQKVLQVKVDDLHQAITIIQALHPKPGNLIQADSIEFVIPDIIVKKVEPHWRVELNTYALPKLSINQHYASMIHRANDSPDNVFLKTNLQEARWFLKSIQSRQETLLRVARCIVEYQTDFFEKGVEAMKPLILRDIAEMTNLHESTISRVTTQKFMYTPRGVFELKYFFSSHVATINGGECSSTAIRAIIKKLILAENRSKPLSDSKIAQLIAEQHIQIARRTVAKYRESMGIAPSNERKTIRS